MYNRSSECCKYRERKLALKKKNKARNKTLNENKNCQEKDADFQSRPTKCPKNNSKKIVKVQSSFTSETNDLLSRIKPSIPEREKYFNPHHVTCFLEDERKESKKGKGEDKEKIEKESWCKKTVHEKLPKSIVECDSICSFDSIVDLAGLALTNEEKKKIEEKREETSQDGRKKKKAADEDQPESAL